MKRAFPSTAATALSVFCLWLPIATPSLAGNATSPTAESVTVEAKNALPGIWRFPPHARQTVWTSKGAQFLVMGPEMFCRIGLAESGYSFDCLELAERSAQAKLDADRDGDVDLSWKFMWGTPGCHWVFHGKLQSNTEISGRLGSACRLRDHEESRWNPDLMTIAKIVLPENTADAGGQAALLKRLLEEAANGQVVEPYAKPHFISSNPDVVPLPDDVQQLLLLFPAPDSLRPLGKITAAIYVGDYFPIVGWWGRLHHNLSPGHEPDSPVYGDKRPVYAVEFENGERLCTLHRRPDGVLDQFQCL
jgi:hypothetical protein